MGVAALRCELVSELVGLPGELLPLTAERREALVEDRLARLAQRVVSEKGLSLTLRGGESESVLVCELETSELPGLRAIMLEPTVREVGPSTTQSVRIILRHAQPGDHIAVTIDEGS